MTQQKRGSGLSRERVIAAALAIADAEGVDAVSFRRLAVHFAVTPMALYRHVGNKEALLDGIGDLVLGELAVPTAESGDWRLQLRATARSFRSLLIAHPAAVPIFMRALLTPAAMRTADALLGLLRRAGFTPREAALRYEQVSRFILALVVLELERGTRASTLEPREPGLIVPADEYPNLVEAAPYFAAYDSGAAFEAGLDLVIAGLERELLPATGRNERGGSESVE